MTVLYPSLLTHYPSPHRPDGPHNVCWYLPSGIPPVPHIFPLKSRDYSWLIYWGKVYPGHRVWCCGIVSISFHDWPPQPQRVWVKRAPLGHIWWDHKGYNFSNSYLQLLSLELRWHTCIGVRHLRMPCSNFIKVAARHPQMSYANTGMSSQL